MRLLFLNDAEYQLLGEMLHRAEGEGFNDEDCQAFYRRFDHLVTTRIPPTLAPSDARPCTRGPRRKLVQIIGTEHGVDALLLECGHIVARHARQGMSAAFCEACVLCQPLEGDACRSPK